MGTVALQRHGTGTLDSLLHLVQCRQFDASGRAIQVSRFKVQTRLNMPGLFLAKWLVLAGQDVGPIF